ncbi:hypothetical protein OCH239_15180 [Roseivivax halodurans JCM 10272]|uniref:YcaO domain-containing protein n=1 Tax=Roseivivax halodurans JCM 10272 TaxID=1449350 RepID=X7EA66_9RHOB|nr:YcaO-like family protein [Roseivivax halodurans]ETX12959.1 hypothetical protein OCH239_15180 [Roseivivax halodurans JCM 10272]
MITLFGQPASAAKAHFDGTHRTRAPEETFADYARHMPAMGITRIGNVTGLDRIGFPVCVAVRPNARALSTSQGKGRSLAAARVSALMEAIETWHGERPEGEIRIASHAELSREGPVPPLRDFPVRADAHLSERHPIPWIRGWDLMAEAPAWLPLETVSTNFVEGGNRPAFLRSTNGLASGNHMLEAVVHALCEVIERDALTMSGLSGTPVPVDPHSVPDPELRQLLDELAEKAVAVFLTDLTCDTGVPTFSCELIDDPESPAWRALPQVDGHGTHLDYRVALSRAVTEAIQARATVISGSRDDLFPQDYRDAVSIEDQLARVENRSAAPLATVRSDATASFEGDLALLLDRLRAVGVRHVLACDLRRSEIGIPVVKVVVPGLEPVRTPFYQPGPRARAVLKEAA